MNNNIIDSIPSNEWDALIHSIVRPFMAFCHKDKTLTVDDLKQEAWIGLIAACEKFDPSRGTKITTFAFPYIRGHVLRSVVKCHTSNSYFVDEDVSTVDTREYYDDNSDFVSTAFDLVKDEEHVDLLREFIINNKSFRQIARERGVCHMTVNNRVGKLLEMLEKRLQHENA